MRTHCFLGYGKSEITHLQISTQRTKYHYYVPYLYIMGFTALKSQTKASVHLLSAGSLGRRPLDDFLSRLRPEVKRLVSSSKGLVGVLDREPLGADP